MQKIVIYTDGGCRGNPGPGGWGAVLEYGKHRKEIKGHANETTNNRMELTAAIEALSGIKRSCAIDLFTDSVYVRDGISKWLANWKKNNWRTANRKAVKNKDLWQTLDELNETHTVTWHWVKGHSGHPGNDRADELANEAMDELMAEQNS
jgi:ribonuclease HI